jgi:hypothetical protein
MFCKHKWKVLSEITTESMAQQMSKIITTIPKPRNHDQAEALYKRKHILVVTCENCGKLKRYVESI